MPPDAPLALTERTGLPEEMRFLVTRIPRPDWHGHAAFGQLSQFYLQRHLMFRRMVAAMDHLSQQAGDGGDLRDFQRQLRRIAPLFLQELDLHHRIEDHTYFPALMKLEPRLVRAFDILDSDHHVIHGALERFAQLSGDALRRTPGDAVLRFGDGVRAMAGLLERHLEDEEEIVIPILLDKGEDALDLPGHR